MWLIAEEEEEERGKPLLKKGLYYSLQKGGIL